MKCEIPSSTTLPLYASLLFPFFEYEEIMFNLSFLLIAETPPPKKTPS